MPQRAFLNDQNEVVALSGHGVTLVQLQATRPGLGATSFIDDAPHSLIHKQLVNPNQSHYHRLDSGDGTDISHYVLETADVGPAPVSDILLEQLGTEELDPNCVPVPDGSGGVMWSPSIASPIGFYAFNTTAQSFNSETYAAISYDSVTVNTGDFTHVPGTPDVVYTGPDGLVFVSAKASIMTTSGNSRSNADIDLFVDSGSGFVKFGGTLGYTYNRQDNFGTTYMSTGLIQVTTGTVFRQSARRATGGSGIQVLPDGASITLFALQGARGPAGPAGSGSTVLAQNSGAPLSSPITTFDYLAGLDVAEVGGGVASVSTRERGRSISLYRAVDTRIPASGVTLLNPDASHSTPDSDAFTWSPGSGVTIAQAGRYSVTATSSFDIDTSVAARGTTRVELQIFTNGSAVPGSGQWQDHEPLGYTPGASISTSVVVDLNVGDVIQPGAQIVSGGSSIIASGGRQSLMIIQLRRD